MFQAMARFTMKPEKVLPHRSESLQIGLNIGGLRSNVYVNAGEIDQSGVLDCAQHGKARVGRRDTELRRVECRCSPMCERVPTPAISRTVMFARFPKPLGDALDQFEFKGGRD